jgi:branched-subunit amino acid transport protein
VSEVWLTIAGLVVTTAAIKAAGPLALGGRDLPARVEGVIALLAPAVLAALVVTQTFGDAEGSLVVDERVAGVLTAGAVLVLRGSLLGAIVGAAAVTALARALIG